MKSLLEAISLLRCDNVLECFFGLNELDVSIYRALLECSMRSQELAKKVGRGENAVYKSLQKLLICGLVVREKKCVDGGGYYYIYSAVRPEKVAERMRESVEELRRKLLKAVDEFEHAF